MYAMGLQSKSLLQTWIVCRNNRSPSRTDIGRHNDRVLNSCKATYLSCTKLNKQASTLWRYGSSTQH